MQDTSNALTLAEATKRIPGRPNRTTVLRWIHRGVGEVKLDAIRVGGRWFIRPADLERFFAELDRRARGGDLKTEDNPRVVERMYRDLKRQGVVTCGRTP